MKFHDPFHEIGDLLRSQKPAPQPSPQLEARILAALERPQRSPGHRAWLRFLLPPAVATAAAVVLCWPRRPAAVPLDAPQNHPLANAAVPPEAGTPSLAFLNPLESENLALQRDARRAGRFLVDCLPSLSPPAP